MFLIPIWVGLALILRPAVDPDWLGIALFVPSMVMAALISFLIGSCFAMFAFWTTRSMSFWDIWMSLTLLLGGQVAPVAVLPGVLQQAAVVLPMRYTVGFPSRWRWDGCRARSWSRDWRSRPDGRSPPRRPLSCFGGQA